MSAPRRHSVVCRACGWRSMRLAPALARRPQCCETRCPKCGGDVTAYRATLPADWKRQRARKASHVARENRHRALLELAERYQSKGAAYAAGYRRGYMTAFEWWRRRVERDQRRASA